VLTCYLYRRRIGAWLDGALDDGMARSTATHVGRCGRCADEADGLRRLKSLLGAVAQPALPDWTGFWPGVVRGIQDAPELAREAREPERRGWRPPRWAYGGALAAALLLSVGVWQFAPSTLAPDAPVIVGSADSGDPAATVMVYSTPERDLTVVWVLGLDDKR
jgi:hypothetical protein